MASAPPMFDEYKIEIDELTQVDVQGNGVFDVLMRAMKGHLEEEFKQSRIRGPEYATVYLGSLQSVLGASLDFLLQQQKAALEAENIKAQTLLIEAQIAKTEVEKAILEATLPKIAAEVLLAEKEVEKIDAEIVLLGLQAPKIEAEVSLLEAEVLKVEAETVLLGLQEPKLEAEILLMEAQVDKVQAEIVLLGLQGPKITKEIEALTAEILKINAEVTLLGLQGPKIAAETGLIESQTDKTAEEILVLIQQKANLVAEGLNIPKAGLRMDAEKDLLIQKKATETAQTNGTGVTTDSVIGKQNALYTAQTEGFARDAEQKAAKIMIDTWSVRRTTDDATVVDAVNKLNDATIGKSVTALLTGINVTP